MTTDTQHPAAWRGTDLTTSTVWVHELTPDEVGELVDLVGRLAGRRAGRSAPPRARAPQLGAVVDRWADELDGGRGFVLVRGLPVTSSVRRVRRWHGGARAPARRARVPERGR